MNDRWNGRLLRAYPRRHRAEYGEEMLAVLAESGGGPREALDLVAGGLKVRLRGLGRPYTAPEWRDALAVVSLVAPLLLTVATASFAKLVVKTATGALPLHSGFWSYVVWATPLWTAGAIALGLAWWGGSLGRWFAVGGLALLCGWTISGAPATPSSLSLIAFGLVTPVLTMAALAFSDGPRRGARVLGRPATLLMLGFAAAAFTAQVLGGIEDPALRAVIAGDTPYYEEAWTVILAALVLNGLRTPHGRRVGALLAAPLLVSLGQWVTVPVPRAADVAAGLALILFLGFRSAPRPVR
ncbi:hypothetical protein [Actinomadura gamaensis]|uniref:Integral membrane protein n=1 Tax=Actinomadura gamaensis TaxID=1763541 RepID=A0ABV9U980_9ACTN